MQFTDSFFWQFWRLAGPFWQAPTPTIRTQSFAIITLTILQMVIAVIITAWSSALFNALEQHSMSGLLTQIGFLVLIFLSNIAVTTSHLKIKRNLQIEWRKWLTERVLRQWMNHAHHYQVTHIQTASHDNPDGRIAEDIRIATEEAISLSHSFFYSVLLLLSFTTLLWSLSGVVQIDLGLFSVQLHGHLILIAIAYASAASFLGWRIGQPLITATDSKQSTEADFRFDLATARDHSLAIALIHSEEDERSRFASLFQHVHTAFIAQTHAMMAIMQFTSGYSVLSTAFPILVSAPRYILGSISLGALMQSAQAFQHMTSALSWPVDNMSGLAQWRASVERVLSLIKALDDLEGELAKPAPNRISFTKGQDSTLRIANLCITQLDNTVCVSCVNAEIRAGERVLITGNTFTSSKLFKVITGLWPWGSGQIELPDDEPIFFMPPRPYLPTGTLRNAICYPSSEVAMSTAELTAILSLVGLSTLSEALDTVDCWEKSLPRDHQQRLGLVRLLIRQPKWILLQESFDSLDPEGEQQMFEIICQHLPNATMLTITNQPTAKQFHTRQIDI